MGETPPAATPQQAPSLDEIPRRVRQAFKLWDKARTRQLAHREVQKFLEALGVTVDGEAVRSGILKYGADGADGTLGPQECNQLYHELLATQAAVVAAAAAVAADATVDTADAATAADAASAVAKAREAPTGRSGADGIQRAVEQLRAEIQRAEAYSEQAVPRSVEVPSSGTLLSSSTVSAPADAGAAKAGAADADATDADATAADLDATTAELDATTAALDAAT